MKDKISVLSFGAGVQSTTLLMMSLAGELPPLDAVVFADTGWEPRAVYAHLEKCWSLCESAGVEFVRVSRGSLRADTFGVIQARKNGERGGMSATLQIPTFSIASTSERVGMMRRFCTKNYKVGPVNKAITKLKRKHKANLVEVWLGISVEEIERMKVSKIKGVKYLHPLAWDLRMSRQGCIEWMLRNEHDRPPRSACTICPYHTNREWKELRDNDGEAWLDAVRLDELVRNMDNGFQTFLHRSGKPLSLVELDDDDDQLSLGFLNECEGMCGT